MTTRIRLRAPVSIRPSAAYRHRLALQLLARLALGALGLALAWCWLG